MEFYIVLFLLMGPIKHNVFMYLNVADYIAYIKSVVPEAGIEGWDK